MTRQEFIKELSGKLEKSQKEVKEILDVVEETIVGVIKEEDELKLNIGKFVGVDKEATTARNPRTGEEIEVAAKRVPKWKSGKLFKEGVN